MELGAGCADKGAEEDVHVRAPVVLAVDAESVELLLLDALAKISTDSCALDVSLLLWCVIVLLGCLGLSLGLWLGGGCGLLGGRRRVVCLL